DHAQVIDAPGDMRKEVADLRAATAIRRELPLRALEKELLVAGAVARLGMIELHLFAVVGVQSWLRIEGIDVRDPAAHEQEDDALRPRLDVGRSRCQRVKRVAAS